MHRGTLLVFDEYVFSPGVAATPPVYTPSDFNLPLGTDDKLAILAVVDQASAATSLFVGLEHSADGRLWVLKNPSASPPLGLEIFATNNAFPISTQTPIWGYSLGTSPSLGEGRLRISFGAAANAHVRIWVTMRDPR